MSFEKTPRNQVKRVPNRGHYDRKTVFDILDAGSVCHVGFSDAQGQPFVIPTIYGRSDDSLFFHGATVSRMVKRLSDGVDVSVCVTHFDGLVLARSAFHHSMNYRSAVLFGTAQLIEGDDKKTDALKVISDQVLKGRWEEVRAPNPQELKATSVLEMKIESASAKIRTGPPVDEAEDYGQDIWAGVMPVHTSFAAPEPDEETAQHGRPLPSSVESAR